MNALLVTAVAFAVGFKWGVMRKDLQWMDLCKSQQERGDYWFHKYMNEVRDDWEHNHGRPY